MAQQATAASTEDAQNIAELVARAHAAQAQIQDYSQEQVNELIDLSVHGAEVNPQSGGNSGAR